MASIVIIRLYTYPTILRVMDGSFNESLKNTGCKNGCTNNFTKPYQNFNIVDCIVSAFIFISFILLATAIRLGQVFRVLRKIQ